jgi:uncharacterized repeat protein (TIGR01451 family)
LQQSGSISQVVTLPAGTYVLDFMAAQRLTNQQTFQVEVDGAVVATVKPSGSQFALYTTGPLAFTAGSHTIKFVGLNPLGGDNTAFLDDILIGPPTDQSGRPRISGPSVDIGAYEVQQASLSPATLPTGQIGVGYSQTLPAATQTGYQSSWGSFTYSYTPGTLPPGLSLSSDGTLSGTPTTAGSFTFTVQAKNLAGFGFQQYTVLVNPPLIAEIDAANSSGTPTTIILPATTLDYNVADNSTDGGNALPVITGNIIIVGNGDTIERTGTNLFRLFDVAAGGSLTLENLTLTGGVAQGTGTAAEGGAIYSAGTLTLSGVTVKSNKAFGNSGGNGSNSGAAGGTGASASGGGLYVAAGNVTLTNDILTSNSVGGGIGGLGRTGVTGGNGGNGGTGLGGAMYVAGGTVTLTDDTLSSNKAQGGFGGTGGAGVSSKKGGSGGTGGAGSGGGMYVAGGTVTLTDDTLKSNNAQGGIGGYGTGRNPGIAGAGSGGAGSGGAMDVAGGTVTLTGDTISSNKAQGGIGTRGSRSTGGYGASGGAAYGGGLYLAAGTIMLTNDTLSGNKAQGGNGNGTLGFGGTHGHGGSGGAAYGGGLYVAGATVTLADDTLSSNKAQGGLGGLAAPGVPNGVPSDGNRGGNGGAGSGGGMYVAGGTVMLTNDTFSTNGAVGGDGTKGGLGNGSLGSITGGNGGSGGAGSGGAVDVAGGTVTLVNDTLSSNSASGGSGGTAGSGSFNGVAGVAGNGGNGGSASGGGLYLGGGTTVMANTLIAENNVFAGMPGGGASPASWTSGLSGTPGSATDPDVSGTVASSDCDLIGNSSGFSATKSTGDIVNVTSSQLTGLLDPSGLQNNGGPTKTIALQAGSLAIDAGDSNAAPAATDQRGYARIVGNGIDIGAYEYGATAASADLYLGGYFGGSASSTVAPGGQISYVLYPTNVSNTAPSNVTLADVLPAGTTLVSWGWLPGLSSSSAPAVGASGTVSAWGPWPGFAPFYFLVVQVDPNTAPGTVISNTASVGPITGDPTPSDNSISFQTTVQAAPTLSVTDAGGAYNGTSFPASATAVGVTGQNVSGSFSYTYYAGTSASGTPLTGAPVNAGTYTVVATFTSTDPGYTSGGTAQATFTISPDPTSISVSASSAAPVYGQGVTLTATVATPPGEAIPTSSDGTVTFYDGGTKLGTANLSDSTATATLTNVLLTAGQHTITASYSGDNNFVTSQTNFEPTSPQVVVLAGGLAGLPSSAVDGQGDVFIADPTNSRVLEVTPSGSETTVGSGLVLPIGVAVDSQGNLFIDDLGLYQEVEVIAGLPLTVSQATPTVSVSDAGGTYNGNAFSATASVAGVVAGVDTTPASTLEGVTPTLTYYQGTYATLAALNTALAGGLTGTSTAPTQAGSYTVVASFAGSTDYSSGQAIATFTISPAATSTFTVGLSATMAVYGQPVTLEATVLNTQTAPTPAGNVTFFDGATKVGSAAVGAGGVATLTVSTLGAGKHALTASFSDPAGNFVSSGSPAAESLTITKASTTTALATTTTTAVFGQAVTFTATVAAVAPSIATPTGSVTFRDGNTTLATVSLSGGAASWTTSKLAVGGHTITATYNGTYSFTASGPATTAVSVSPDATTAVVTSSVASPVYGQAVTLKATVKAAAPGAGTPTGMVSFYDGATLLGSATLSNGMASLKTTALSVGANSITVVYSGDGNFLGTTSAALAVTVNQDATRTKLTSSSTTAAHGMPVTLTATVLAASPGSGAPTGTVSFWDGSTLLGTVNLSGGVAQLTWNFAVVGKHKIKAVYNGDADFLVSTSAVLTQTIT